MSDDPRDGREQRSEATRSALVAAARSLFVERGYAAVSTGDIARVAAVTRNALYYHFPTKEAVFRAVYENVEGELAERVLPAALAHDTSRAQLEAGIEEFLDGCLDPTVARISVLQAPAALGFAQMREIDNRNYLGALRDGIRSAIDAGELPDLPADTLASMIIGALDEAALLIATADDPAAARHDAGLVAQALVDGLFVG
ncbi:MULTISPECIES: TetR/AcrR family transcriptional regulator [Mycolicibacterium]|jgi:AcrR family transcriptional regulator|uniref:TetR/AcrR family transcriptional regulator n=2 Tax=Mycolicibacterium TaxID=1866885 RepID=A0ABW9LPT5_9MYCO|nr:TetR/AcrR family transcriptional regulator [Mycolicibacterium nivoides]MBN3510077.1 TetR/AcrR family transcriptional regulator [Mycolicibacterium septicum]QRY45706.1 TetR/AcrR family transcriptional regulator [Mycolicibacterium boenickei]SEQ71893.1 DNA-binding transcriptional regulator, AcrR family [Mycobacterium sp. 88mf]SFF62682.1 DNA-binding transcriptional regulator, AcrR family [Mycobacterium sp. 455mf]